MILSFRKVSKTAPLDLSSHQNNQATHVSAAAQVAPLPPSDPLKLAFEEKLAAKLSKNPRLDTLTFNGKEYRVLIDPVFSLEDISHPHIAEAPFSGSVQGHSYLALPLGICMSGIEYTAYSTRLPFLEDSSMQPYEDEIATPLIMLRRAAEGAVSALRHLHSRGYTHGRVSASSLHYHPENDRVTLAIRHETSPSTHLSAANAVLEGKQFKQVAEKELFDWWYLGRSILYLSSGHRGEVIYSKEYPKNPSRFRVFQERENQTLVFPNRFPKILRSFIHLLVSAPNYNIPIESAPFLTLSEEELVQSYKQELLEHPHYSRARTTLSSDVISHALTTFKESAYIDEMNHNEQYLSMDQIHARVKISLSTAQVEEHEENGEQVEWITSIPTRAEQEHIDSLRLMHRSYKVTYLLPSHPNILQPIHCDLDISAQQVGLDPEESVDIDDPGSMDIRELSTILYHPLEGLSFSLEDLIAPSSRDMPAEAPSFSLGCLLSEESNEAECIEAIRSLQKAAMDLSSILCHFHSFGVTLQDINLKSFKWVPGRGLILDTNYTAASIEVPFGYPPWAHYDLNKNSTQLEDPFCITRCEATFVYYPHLHDFAAPECTRSESGRGSLSPAIGIWESGVILLSLALGRKAYEYCEGDSVEELVAAPEFIPSCLPKEFRDFLSELLRVSPSERLAPEYWQRMPFFTRTAEEIITNYINTDTV